MALHGRVSRPLPERGLGTRLGNIIVLVLLTSLFFNADIVPSWDSTRELYPSDLCSLTRYVLVLLYNR